MASFYELTVGQQIEFQRVIAQAGLTSELAKRMIKHPELAQKMVDALTFSAPAMNFGYQPPSWYVSPEEQIVRVSDFLDRFGGNLPRCRKSDIPAIPEWTPRTSTEVLLLMVYLPDYGTEHHLQRTFDAWWEFCQAPNKWRSAKLKSDGEHLWPVPSVPSMPHGARWVVIDPMAHAGISPVEARKITTGGDYWLAGVEVLALTALCPQWVKSWDVKTSLAPNLAGLQVCKDSKWTEVPFLGRNDQRYALDFTFSSVEKAYPDFASPTVRSAL